MGRIKLVNSITFEKNVLRGSLGSLSLATILNSAGFSTEIVDIDYLISNKIIIYSESFDTMCDNIANYLLEENPSIIGFYTLCSSYIYTLEICKKIKKLNSKIVLILGGPQATLTAKETLETYDFIDLVGLGESEKTILPIVKECFSLKDFSNLPGIAYRANNQVIINSNNNLIEDLDELPYLDYNLIKDSMDKELVQIDVGRGCPYQCTFCVTNLFWKRRFRLKSAKRIISEMNRIFELFGTKRFSLNHDLFTVDKKKVLNFCQELSNNKYSYKWGCSSRLDTLDKETIIAMSEAGCFRMFLGIETGSSRMQADIKKNLPLEKTVPIIECLLVNKIKPTVSFIYGFPNESIDDFRQTMDLLVKLMKYKGVIIQLHKLTAFPGSTITNNLKNKLFLSENKNDLVASNISTSYLPNVLNEAKNSKVIHSSYYNFDNPIRNKYHSMDICIITLSTMKESYGYSLSRLLSFYGNDILRLYDENTEDLIELKNKYYSVESSVVDKERDTLLHKFFIKLVNKMLYNETNDILERIFEFESYLYDFIYNSKETKRTFNFPINVFRVINNNDSELDKIYHPITVKFQRFENERVKINRIA